MITSCQHCNEVFDIQDSLFGQISQCPFCGKQFKATMYVGDKKHSPITADGKINVPETLLKKSIKTKCPNLECGQKYKVSANAIGSVARCKRCNTVFKVEEFKEPEKEFSLEIEEPPSEEKVDEKGRKKRKSSKEIMREKIDAISEEVDRVLPLLMDSLEKKDNESDTRLLIDSMIQHVLGYDIADIKTEQKIEGKRADYVLSVDNKDVIVVEAKRIGMNLKDNQIYQATAYGAYSGIKWVVLTNAVVWQLYRVSGGEKLENNLIFTINLLDGLDSREAEWFYLISKDGMSRASLLENLWEKIKVLSEDNVINAILSDDVITKIRTVLVKQTGYKKITNEELKQFMEENIFNLS